MTEAICFWLRKIIFAIGIQESIEIFVAFQSYLRLCDHLGQGLGKSGRQKFRTDI